MDKSFYDIAKLLNKFKNMIATRDEYEDSLEELDEIIEDSMEPLLVMVMGEFSTGKSTFINALVGKKIAAVNATPTTAIITKLCYGESDKVIVHYKDGSLKENSVVDFDNVTSENQFPYQRHDEISFVERRMPVDMLKSMSIIDSPGLNSLNQGHTIATRNFVDKADVVLWMFDANKPISQTEMTAMNRLRLRLKPIAIINKMDALNDDEDDVTEFLDGIQQKLKDKVQRVIGISAKLAFIGQERGDERQLAASNIQEFYTALDELVLPNIKTYKMNTLMDDMSSYVFTIGEKIKTGEIIVAGMQDEDYASYMEERQKQVALLDGLEEMLIPFHQYATAASNKNASACAFSAALYYYGFLVEKNEDLAKRLAEEAALRNDDLAQMLLATIYVNEAAFDRAVYWVHRLADKKFPEGQRALGKMYQAGLGIEENAEEAVRLFEKAAKQEYDGGVYELAYCYLTGYGVPKDHKRGFELLEKSVKLGSTEAMLALGNRYLEGDLVPKDEKIAFELYERAARKGDADGQFQLAFCYFKGLGTTENPDRAIYWLRRAAMQDVAEAQCLIGRAYQDGYGVAQNEAKAMMWLKRAADNGSDDAMLKISKMQTDSMEAFSWIQKAAEAENDEAQLQLGNCYRNGNAVTVDYAKAMNWYRKAAELGNTSAMNNVGYMYHQGLSVAQNYNEALSWYKKAAELGDAVAMNNVGYMYQHGLGVAQNYNEAFGWYKKAAELGNASAMYNIGYMYHRGLGVTQDYDAALRWYKKAAELGDADAMYHVGDMYYYGRGIAQDYDEALSWYKKAAELGNATAMNNVGYMYHQGLSVAQNYNEAFGWYKKAAELGNATAMYHVGYMYHRGLGVTQDYDAALRWYKKAASHGSEEAAENLNEVRRVLENGNRPDEMPKEEQKTGLCFITTAVCTSFNKPDDCYELTMFRRFRDTWLSAQLDGSTIIKEYYRIAPAIVQSIDSRPDNSSIYREIWSLYLLPCLHYVETGANNKCKELYIKMVKDLEKRFV